MKNKGIASHLWTRLTLWMLPPGLDVMPRMQGPGQIVIEYCEVALDD